jgi:transposase
VAGEEEKDRRIAELERQLAERDRRIEKLERKIEQLERINEDLRRAGKRQATPFSRGEPKAKPKRRGRKKGKRYGARASRPVPKQIDRIVHVGAPMYCPECQKPTKLIGQEKQWQTDIPPVQATTTEFRIDIAQCTECGRTFRVRHPEQTSQATGAAGVQIGPRAIAFAAKFNKECGVSYGRIADIFEKGFGLVTNRSTLARAVQRLANRLEPEYEQIGEKVRGSPMLSPDETGWKIGGHKAWLHVAATREESYFVIARGRGREEAEDLIGADYNGTIVRDGWIAYRGRGAFPKAKSQTCLAHILRRIEGLLELSPDGPALLWLTTLKKLLKRAIRIRDRRDGAQIGPHGLIVAIAEIESAFDQLLDTCPSHCACRRLAAHLRRERKAIFTFLHQDAVPATNYLAEQAIRPAVVNRKMSGGNNTLRGARTQQILMTVFHTARKRGADALLIATNALRNLTSGAKLFER